MNKQILTALLLMFGMGIVAAPAVAATQVDMNKYLVTDQSANSSNAASDSDYDKNDDMSDPDDTITDEGDDSSASLSSDDFGQ